jgi:hypothetical protein
MSTRTFTLGAALLALSATLAGCASTGAELDRGFGDSVRAATASQILDPAAVRNTNPVLGIDGRAAQAAQLKYQASFADPGTADQGMIGSRK